MRGALVLLMHRLLVELAEEHEGKADFQLRMFANLYEARHYGFLRDPNPDAEDRLWSAFWELLRDLVDRMPVCLVRRPRSSPRSRYPTLTMLISISSTTLK